jgi:hypothetical protein
MGTLSLPSIQAHLKSCALRAIGGYRNAARGRTGDPDHGRAGMPNYLVKMNATIESPNGRDRCQAHQ